MIISLVQLLRQGVEFETVLDTRVVAYYNDKMVYKAPRTSGAGEGRREAGEEGRP